MKGPSRPASHSKRNLSAVPGTRYTSARMLLAPQEIRTFFITAVTANRRRLFQVPSNTELLLKILNEDRIKSRYQLHAFVIMPDHIHLLITPAPDVSIEKAVQFIKGGFSFRLQSKIGVWQSGFTKRRIKDARDYVNHLVYIHHNPVRAGLCERSCDFPYSSGAGIFRVDSAPAHFSRADEQVKSRG